MNGMMQEVNHTIQKDFCNLCHSFQASSKSTQTHPRILLVRSSGLYASFLRRQGHQGILEIVNLHWEQFKGTKATSKGHGGNRLQCLCEVSGLNASIHWQYCKCNWYTARRTFRYLSEFRLFPYVSTQWTKPKPSYFVLLRSKTNQDPPSLLLWLCVPWSTL